jgi:phosphatidate phosphatase APP1
LSRRATFLPINGFVTQQKLWVEGQIVLINPKYLKYSVKESTLNNFLRLLKFYSPKHISHRTLQLYYKDEKKWEIELDNVGYFRVTLDLEEMKDFEPNDIRYYLGESKIEVHKPEYSKDNIYRIEDEGKIIVSDIDDTVLISHATNKLKKIFTLIRYGALQRQQVEAMNEFFGEMSEKHGFIYLSNSEMNLYPLIKNFLTIYKFPKGPLFLREHMNISQVVSRKYRSLQTKHHKIHTLGLLIRAFPNKKFILVGDSGQKDPDIYRSIAKEFRNQVEKIFIREIPGKERHKKLEGIKVELEELGIEVVLFKTGKNLLS